MLSTACPGGKTTSNHHAESGDAHTGALDPEELLAQRLVVRGGACRNQGVGGGPRRFFLFCRARSRLRRCTRIPNRR
jgi:hypothetical protein